MRKIWLVMEFPLSHYTPTLASQNGARNASVIRLRRTRFESECEKNMVSYGVPTLTLHTHTSFTEWGAEYQRERERECEIFPCRIVLLSFAAAACAPLV